MTGYDVTEKTELIRSIAPKLDRPVVLIGMMGSGKSRLGKMLSEQLELPFTDSDSEIESAANCSIPEIFELYGEGFFRDAERKIIKRIIDGEVKVIATGGGTFVNPDTAEFIKQNAISIWLRASADLLIKRLSASKNPRPMLQSAENPEEVIKRLVQEREQSYKKADIIVDSMDVPHDVTLGVLMEKLDGYLNRG